MHINVAESSGFCFGVTRALNICRELLKEKDEVYILADIVHNERVVSDLKKKGLKKLKELSPMQGATLVISAHGAGQTIFYEASKCGFDIVDATCPKVKEIYDIAQRLEKDRLLVIIGDEKHDEVKGIAGQLKKEPVIVESPEKIPSTLLASVEKIGIVTQSTQAQSNIQSIVQEIKAISKDVKFVDTTCRITRVKQEEIRSLPRYNDIVLILGSRSSANTKRLFEISKKENENTYWLEDSSDLKKEMLRGCKKVGIMAGASTPDIITREVIEKIESLEKKTDRDVSTDR